MLSFLTSEYLLSFALYPSQGVFGNDDDLVIIGENVRKSSNGKTIEAINQVVVRVRLR